MTQLNDAYDELGILLGIGVYVENFPLLIGETDDTARIQRAINSIASGFVILANKTYNITSLTMKSGVFLYALNGTLKLINNAPVGNIMINFVSVSNTGIYGVLNIDGNRSNNLSASNSQEGVKIQYGCSDLFFDTLLIKNTSEDGLYIGGVTAPCPRNIHIKKVIVDNAGRNGISITSGQDIFLGDITTRNTIGVDPQDGVDIETNLASDVLKNINIESLNTYSNAGTGLQILGTDITNLTQGDVTIKRLVTHDNQGNGINLVAVSYITILSGAAYNNTAYGIAMPRNLRHFRIRMDIYKNQKRGVSLVMTTQDIQSYDFDFSGSRFFNNGQETANTYDGIRIDSDDALKPISRVYLDNVSLFDDQVTHTQRYGFSTGPNTERIRVTGDIFGNATGDYAVNGTKTRVTLKEHSASLSMGATSVPANSTLNYDITVTGVVSGGSRVLVTPSSIMPSGLVWSAYIPSNNTIRIVLANPTASAVSVSAMTWYLDYLTF